MTRSMSRPPSADYSQGQTSKGERGRARTVYSAGDVAVLPLGLAALFVIHAVHGLEDPLCGLSVRGELEVALDVGACGNEAGLYADAGLLHALLDLALRAWESHDDSEYTLSAASAGGDPRA